jgi:hypothetical protein
LHLDHRLITWDPDSLGDRIWKRHPDLTAVIIADLPLTRDYPIFQTDPLFLDNYPGLVWWIWGSVHDSRRRWRGCMHQGRTEKKAADYADSNSQTVITMAAPETMVT